MSMNEYMIIAPKYVVHMASALWLHLDTGVERYSLAHDERRVLNGTL